MRRALSAYRFRLPPSLNSCLPRCVCAAVAEWITRPLSRYLRISPEFRSGARKISHDTSLGLGRPRRDAVMAQSEIISYIRSHERVIAPLHKDYSIKLWDLSLNGNNGALE